MLRIGIMGGGGVADYGHIPAIKQTPGLTLAALFEPDPDRLAWMQQRHDIPDGATHPQEFFEIGLDAVAVTSPLPAHHDNVLAAAARGLPVLCEKPLAMSAPQARAMIDAMAQAGAPLYTAFCYRYAGVARKIKQLLADGAIGEPRSLRLIYNWDCHGKWELDPETRRWRLNPRREGRMIEGGPMVDCGVHQIDLARWWLGRDIVRWEAHGAWVDEYRAPDHVYLHMDHEGGCHTLVEMSYSYGHQCKDPRDNFRYELIGPEGVIAYDRGSGLFEWRSGRGTESFGYMPEKDFAGMYQAYERTLRTGETGDMCPADQGLIATNLARQATDRLIARREQTQASPCPGGGGGGGLNVFPPRRD